MTDDETAERARHVEVTNSPRTLAGIRCFLKACREGAGGCRFMANAMIECYGRASEQNQVWIVNWTAELETVAALLD